MMEEVVLTGAKTQICGNFPGPHGGMRFKFSKLVGGRKLAVIAECKAGDCWLITGYYEN